MRYLKTLTLFGAVLGTMMAFSATASATWLTSPTGTVYTGPITATSHGAIELHGSFVTVKCSHAHLEGHIQSHSTEYGVPAKGPLTTHSMTGCNYTVTMLKPGSIEIHSASPLSGVEHTGTVTTTGTEMSIHTSVGTCVFTTSNTDIGTLTPSNDTGGHATIDIASAKIPRTAGSFLCGSSGTLTGGYTITTPTTLYVDDHTF